MLNKILLFLSSVQILFHIQATLTSIAVFLVIFSHTNVIHSSKRVWIVTEIHYCILRKVEKKKKRRWNFGVRTKFRFAEAPPYSRSHFCVLYPHVSSPTAKYRQAVGSAEENNFKRMVYNNQFMCVYEKMGTLFEEDQQFDF